ncbi:MAG: hypothetical protein F6K51_21795 [Moorea sp. SIO3I8]|nr:hypothetical protein [Moorena sp. SIO3I8]NEO19860.1 hypothetical protein [Moorena sp. SIO4A5]
MDGVRRGEEWNGILLGRRYGIDRSRSVGLCPKGHATRSHFPRFKFSIDYK